MPGSRSSSSGRNKSLARIRGQDPMPFGADISDSGATEEDRANGFFRQRNESSPSRTSFSSSLNQKTPARSYFQHSFQDSHGEFQLTQTL